MRDNLIINIHRANIDVVFSSFEYHSKKSTLLNIKKGSYVVFIAPDPVVKKYEIIGYFAIDHSYIDNDSLRAKKWGQYSIIANPLQSKLIEGLYLNDLLSNFERKFTDRHGRLAIGIGTQGPTYLSNHDLQIIFENAKTFTDEELLAVHRKLVEDKVSLFDHKNNYK